jgi:hypothetical protein
MYFAEMKNVALCLRSMWGMYFLAFSRSSETHYIATSAQFLKVLERQFVGVQAVEVSENHVVLLNLGLRDEALWPSEVQAFQRDSDFQCLQSAQNIEPTKPKNQFNVKLMEHPMLALPNPHPNRRRRHRTNQIENNDKQDNDDQNNGGNQTQSKQKQIDGAAPPGPFLQRLQRRAQNLPLGDEEPGFPGVSMKLEQKRMKKKIAAYRNASLKMAGKDSAKRPTKEDYERITNEVAEVFPIGDFGLTSKPHKDGQDKPQKNRKKDGQGKSQNKIPKDDQDKSEKKKGSK